MQYVKGKAKQNLLLAIVVFTYVPSILEELKGYKKVALKKYANGTVYKAVFKTVHIFLSKNT